MKPRIPQGTRDFGPVEAARRQYIFDILRGIFISYGYAPLETPAMELAETLTGKYGDEGDKLIYRILNSGNYLKEVSPELLKQDSVSSELTRQLCERALRYDLTIPFARFVSMNQNNLKFPFRRFQIQPVWRADKPQRGRYREFFQCDIDIIGTDGLLAEAELIDIYNYVFQSLKIKHYVIRLNHRKLLMGMASQLNCMEQFAGFTNLIDKLDKIGIDEVIRLLKADNILQDTHEKLIREALSLCGDNRVVLEKYVQLFPNEHARQGYNDLIQILNYHDNDSIEIDYTLARGLDYYTGTIFEVIVNDPASSFKGSISGGGRYDNLTGIFGFPDMSGVGISFGADRIYDVMEELKLFPENLYSPADVLIYCMDEKYISYGFEKGRWIRNNKLRVMMYPQTGTKLKKIFQFAEHNQIPWLILIGEDEVQSGKLTVKHITTGQQETNSVEEIIKYIKTLQFHG